MSSLRTTWAVVALCCAACSGLTSIVDAGNVDSGTGGGVGGGTGGGGTGGGGTMVIDAGCVTELQCPHPANSAAICTDGRCEFLCNTPLLRCGQGCCSAVSITAGMNHTCITTSEGGAKCWGQVGTVGDGSFNARSSPVDVIGLSAKIVQISAGNAQTCARLETGFIECWGINALGNGVDGAKGRATRTALTLPATDLAMGFTHGCAVADAGAWCWGDDTFGQQGTNSGGKQLSPGSVSGLAYDVKQLAAAGNHSCALLNDGGAWCWGQNFSGACGDGTSGGANNRSTPVPVTVLDAGIRELHAGANFTCARTGDFEFRCFGLNASGECGVSSSNNVILTPGPVLGLSAGLTRFSPGGVASHVCAVQDGGALCWGNNDDGQLGDGTVLKKTVPTPVMGLMYPVTAIAPGGSHTCAIAGGGVFCWGDNGTGQLGNGTMGAKSLVPVQVR